MNQSELDALKALESKATKGPWDLVITGDNCGKHIVIGVAGKIRPKDIPDDDCLFIAAARTALPRLIAEVEGKITAEKERDEARKEVQRLREALGSVGLGLIEQIRDAIKR